MHLTGRALLLALVATVAFVAAAWSGDPDIAGLWRLPLLLLCVGLVFESWRQSQVQVWARLSLPPMLRLGREAQVVLELDHGSARPQRLRWVVPTPAALRLRDAAPQERLLAPGVVECVPLTLDAQRLGRERWPALSARLLGALGLAWWDRELDPAVTVRVMPDLLPRGAGRVETPAAGARRTPQPQAEREVHRWRRWEAGDPLSRIDWKVTARSGVLTTRELRDDQHLDVLLCIDAGCGSAAEEGGLDELGARVNLAARLAESVLARGDRVGLLAFADRVLVASRPVGGPAALARLRSRLAVLAPDALPADPSVAARAAARLLRARGTVLWFGDPLCDAPRATTVQAPLRALALRHAVVVAMPREAAVEALAVAASELPRRGHIALAAERRMAASRARASLLRDAGFDVVSGTPARLESAVWAATRRTAHASRRAR